MYCQQPAVSTSATLRYLTDKHVAHVEQGQTCGLSKSGIKQFWQYKEDGDPSSGSVAEGFLCSAVPPGLVSLHQPVPKPLMN